MDFTAVAQSFVKQYYTAFDGDITQRATLASLYRPESMLTWEGSQQQGTQHIIAKLSQPELTTVKHHVTSADAQPSAGGGVLVSVVGSLVLDNNFDKPMSFTQVFTLQPIPGQPGGFFVYNDIFRLILG